MRVAMLAALAAVVAGWDAAAQERPRATVTDPRSYWPPEGRVGVAAIVASRTGGCRLSFILLNNTDTRFRDITLTVEIARSATLGTITDVTFRYVDPGGLRDADGWAMRGCERQPRVRIRAALCSTGPLAYRECLGRFMPVSPPARGAERARITISED
ncbi:MAG: hypothetical protein ACK4ST_02515 [Elioraea tepidiphila]